MSLSQISQASACKVPAALCTRMHPNTHERVHPCTHACTHPALEVTPLWLTLLLARPCPQGGATTALYAHRVRVTAQRPKAGSLTAARPSGEILPCAQTRAPDQSPPPQAQMQQRICSMVRAAELMVTGCQHCSRSFATQLLDIFPVSLASTLGWQLTSRRPTAAARAAVTHVFSDAGRVVQKWSARGLADPFVSRGPSVSDARATPPALAAW